MSQEKRTITNVISDILDMFEGNRLSELGVFRVTEDRVATPIENDTLSMITYRTSLPDQLRDWSIIRSLIEEIKKSPYYKGINHVGFCYKVDSTATESRRLVGVAKNNGVPIYREESNDEGEWLFVGDISDITSPVLELIPHEGGTGDRWEDYWLPHIQFDIDTGLSPDMIVKLVHQYINEPGIPFPIQIEGVTYIERVRLGCIDGVNIFLDFSTSNRDINYRKSWTRLA